ncbi:tetratricopeptide repeat protein [Bdellovibrio svalbardensis]|uniref:Tetratricopeptide repeat protein n=1 Tax=Bdellovibrio svalbardensis TaxID=2972972 RepID=A0ABT6DIT1_9BACT|nr:tetratricopeptide repeat protein [Bdellovibrio svalbardensis]MDG0816760.1 tetratricopeptide repeat protein [Bdellovibrio svalbardensis]
MNRINKSLTLIALYASVVACSSSPTKETKTDSVSSTRVTEAPVIQKDEPAPVAAAEPEPEKPKAPLAPSQYAGLNEAIKSQSDERIYSTATQILAQSSNDAKALNALSMYHYKKGRFDLSRYLLNKAITASPKTAELYSNLGIVQLAQNERREAVKSFRKALDIDNDDAVAAANLGAIYVQDRDFAKAGIVLETAYRKGVRDPRVLNNYAIALTANGKTEKAEDLYKSILKDNSSNKEAMYNYAVLLVERMGKYQEGLDLINRLKFVGGPADTRNKIIALETKAKAGLK